jgi:hypothetical protein
MAFNLTGVFTQVGTAIGFTAATVTLTPSTVTIPYGKETTITAKGGTSPSAVDIHSASRPNRIRVVRPSAIRQLPALNANGALSNVPLNQYKITLEKGVLVLAGQPSQFLGVDVVFRVPAGSDVADPDNLAAGVVELNAFMTSNQQAIIDMLKTGES